MEPPVVDSANLITPQCLTFSVEYEVLAKLNAEDSSGVFQRTLKYFLWKKKDVALETARNKMPKFANYSPATPAAIAAQKLFATICKLLRLLDFTFFNGALVSSINKSLKREKTARRYQKLFEQFTQHESELR